MCCHGFAIAKSFCHRSLSCRCHATPCLCHVLPCPCPVFWHVFAMPFRMYCHGIALCCHVCAMYRPSLARPLPSEPPMSWSWRCNVLPCLCLCFAMSCHAVAMCSAMALPWLCHVLPCLCHVLPMSSVCHGFAVPGVWQCLCHGLSMHVAMHFHVVALCLPCGLPFLDLPSRQNFPFEALGPQVHRSSAKANCRVSCHCAMHKEDGMAGSPN